ncbi:hypothetical protein BDR07DRAFT_543139 [Suillus spraguei]|nr:hypothetical protein BDR07DRAFT_543139 [Suillus spraguei]
MSSVPYWTVSSSSTARPIIATQTSYRNAAQAEHRNEWEEVSPVSVDCDADIVSLDGSRTHEDMQILHLSKLLDEAKQENRRFEERVQSLLNQSMTETSGLQSKIRELRQRNKEALAECERTKKENEDAVAALTKKNDAMRATLQQQNQDMQQALEDLNCSSAHAQAELLDVRNSMQVCRQQLTQSSAQLESLRKEQTARMSLTERVAVLEAEMTKLSSQAKSADASISCDESTTLVQEFNNIRALLENCIPERPAGVSSTSMMSSSNKVVSALRKLNSDIHQDAIEPMTESLHECVKKLLGENHEEEDIESLCQLLKTVVARGDSGRHRNASGTMPVSGNRQVSMNNFQSPGSKLIGEEWFAMANSRSVPTNNASSQFRSPMVRTPSTGEPGHPMDGTNRVCSTRGERRGNTNKAQMSFRKTIVTGIWL